MRRPVSQPGALPPDSLFGLQNGPSVSRDVMSGRRPIRLPRTPQHTMLVASHNIGPGDPVCRNLSTGKPVCYNASYAALPNREVSVMEEKRSDEQLYREARRRVEAKKGFFIHLRQVEKEVEKLRRGGN